MKNLSVCLMSLSLLVSVALADNYPGGGWVNSPYVAAGRGTTVPARFSAADLQGYSDFNRQFNVVSAFDQNFYSPRFGNVRGKILVMRGADTTVVAFYYPVMTRGNLEYALQGQPAVIQGFGDTAIENHPEHRVPCVIVRVGNRPEFARVYLHNDQVFNERHVSAPAPAPAQKVVVEQYWHREPVVEHRHHHRESKFDWRGLVGGVLDATARAFDK